MTRKRSQDGHAGGRLSEEDVAFWEHTAQSVDPVRGMKGRVHASLGDRLALTSESGHPRAQSGKAKSGMVPGVRVEAIFDKPHPVGQGATRGGSAPPLNDVHRRQARKLANGRVEIEARLDLHGLRQSEAHDALRRFLVSAHARGLRWVLVITGKGGGLAGGRAREADGFLGGEERGVLRRNVPRWLAEPQMRQLVVGFREAAIRHGGEGALYVQMRGRG